jgi:hypothetical protein
MKKVRVFVEGVTETLVSTLLNGMTVETVQERELIDSYLVESNNLLREFNIIYSTRFKEELSVNLPVYHKGLPFEEVLDEFIQKLDEFYPYVESLPELASIVTNMLKLTALTKYKYDRL